MHKNSRPSHRIRSFLKHLSRRAGTAGFFEPVPGPQAELPDERCPTATVSGKLPASKKLLPANPPHAPELLANGNLYQRESLSAIATQLLSIVRKARRLSCRERLLLRPFRST